MAFKNVVYDDSKHVLEVGEKDIPAILKEIAKTMPELAIVFSECTTIALRVEAGNATKRSLKKKSVPD